MRFFACVVVVFCMVWGGGGGGDRLESPVEIHSIFERFFLHVLLLFLYGLWGGVNC